MKNICAIALMLVLFITGNVMAQTTFVIDAVPRYYTPLLENIYLAPSFDTWNPGDAKYMFTKQSDGKYYLTFKNAVDTTFQFKFTRGDWTRVEVDAAGVDIANRSFSYSSDTMHFTIAQWHDMLIGTNTATSNVNILITNFEMPQLNRTRRLWVYLPSDYYTSGLSYPVLYMQDGQNVFDALYSFAGEWHVDESLSVAKPVRDCIVIAIDNGDTARINEYSPWIDPTYGGGEGEEYMEFMVNTLKPFIDSIFRTLPEPEHTGILGSSMGGLISMYGGLKYMNTYGRVGAFSPSFWFANYAIDTYAAGITPSPSQKIYFTSGTDESSTDNVVQDVGNFMAVLNKDGYAAFQLDSFVFQGGQHSEYYWSLEFPAAYQWLNLWGTTTNVSTIAPNEPGWSLANYNNSFARITTDNNIASAQYSIMVSDELGRVLYRSNPEGINSFIDIPISNFPSGIYSFSLISVGRLDTKRMAVIH